MAYVKDNYDLWDAYDVMREERLARRPVCCYCKEHIQEEHGYEFGDGICCEECAEEKIWEKVKEDYEVVIEEDD